MGGIERLPDEELPIFHHQYDPPPKVPFQEQMEKRIRESDARRDAADWPEMKPLPEPRVHVPTLPLRLLPEALHDWIADAAERQQVPAEMVATAAIVGSGALVGRLIGIYPKRLDSWIVVPNLWGMIIGRPGIMKTPAMREGVYPLDRLAATARETYLHNAKGSATKLAAIELQIAVTKKQATKQGADIDQCAARIAALSTTRQELICSERRYITQDATIEKLAELMVMNPRGMLLLRDELSGWFETLQKAGREGERQFYLEGWNGDGHYTSDRIGRGTIHVPALTLSVFGTIQPAKLMACLGNPNGGDAGDGLLQRFSLSVWPETPVEWRNVDRLPLQAAKERAWRAFKGLDDLKPVNAGASDTDGHIPALRFADDAQELFDVWRLELEHRLRSSELAATPAFEGHLSKYRKVMPALALLMHLFDIVDERALPGPVTLAAAKRAAAWCEFLEAHARKLYRLDLDPTARAARTLIEKIRSGAVKDGGTCREVHRQHWAGLSTPEMVDAALAFLAGFGWVRVEAAGEKGRPSRIIRLHPSLHKVGQ